MLLGELDQFFACLARVSYREDEDALIFSSVLN